MREAIPSFQSTVWSTWRSLVLASKYCLYNDCDKEKKCGCRDASVVESTGSSLRGARFESYHAPAACLLLASTSTRYTSVARTSMWERHENPWIIFLIEKRKNQKKKEVVSIVSQITCHSELQESPPSRWRVWSGSSGRDYNCFPGQTPPRFTLWNYHLTSSKCVSLSHIAGEKAIH